MVRILANARRNKCSEIRLQISSKPAVLLLPFSRPPGEWEFGGFPAYLLAQNPPVTLRTFEAGYISHVGLIGFYPRTHRNPPSTKRRPHPIPSLQVDRWWGQLLPTVKPFLYQNGGPIVMMQVENEFGSYGDVSTNPADLQYMQHLVGLARRYLGSDLILYTTDGGSLSYMTRGSLNGSAVYTVGDFGPGGDYNGSFAVCQRCGMHKSVKQNQRLALFDTPSFLFPLRRLLLLTITPQAMQQMNPQGMSPNMCTEFYSGWLTHWTEAIANTSTEAFVKSLDQVLSDHNASISVYMAHGGTSFGFWSGANFGSFYQPDITSYDYNAPIAEDGRHGIGKDGADKFAATLAILQKYQNAGSAPPPPEPAAPVFFETNFTLTEAADLLDNIPVLTNGTFAAPYPSTTEKYGQHYGFTLFSTFLAQPGNGTLVINGVRDRAQVFVDGA